MRQLSRFVMVSVVLALSACSGIQDKERNFSLTPQQQQALSQVSAGQAVQEARALLARAKQEKYSEYAPRHLQRAMELLREARTLLARRQPDLEVHKKVALIKRYIEDGGVVVRMVQTEMQAVFSQRDYLLSVGAHKRATETFQEFGDEIKEIIELYEEGNKHKATLARQELMQAMIALEIEVALNKALEEPRQLLAEAEDKGFDELAPKSYQQLQDAMADAEVFIRQNSRDLAGIEEQRAKAVFAGKHLAHVGAAVKGILSLSRNQFEQLILDEEQRLLRIVAAAKLNDVRDRPLPEQVDAIIQGLRGQGRVPRR